VRHRKLLKELSREGKWHISLGEVHSPCKPPRALDMPAPRRYIPQRLSPNALEAP